MAKLGDVANILGAFLVEEVGKLPEPDTGRQILKAFITREGTRKSIARENVAQDVASFGGAIEAAVLDDHLERLAKVRILREVADTDSFELRHDALAATIAGWITEVEKELIEVRDNVQNRYKEYAARGRPQSALLDQDFIEYLDVFHGRLDPLLDGATKEYIGDSRHHQQRSALRRRKITFASCASGVSLVILSGGLYIRSLMHTRNEATEARTTAELNASQAQAERESAVKARQQAEEQRRLAHLSEVEALTAKKQAEEETKRADQQAKAAEANRKQAFANLTEAKKQEQLAREAASQALASEQKATQALAAARKSEAEAKAANEVALREKARAEESEREQTRDLFESYLSQAILRAANQHFSSARDALDESVLTANKAGPGGIDPNRIALRNTVAWLIELASIESSAVSEDAGFPLKAIVAGPKGRRLIFGDEAGNVGLHDLTNGKLVQSLAAHEDLVSEVVFDPDGRWVASAGADRFVNIHQSDLPADSTAPLPNLKTSHRLEANGAIQALEVSSDGQLLVTGDEDGGLFVWDPDTGRKLADLRGHRGAITDAAFSGDGQRLISICDDRSIRVWQHQGSGRFKLLITIPKTEDVPVRATLSQDGNLVAVVGMDDIVRLWDVRKEATVQRLFGHQNTVTDIEFFNEDRMLITSSLDRTVRIWEIESGITARVLEGHETGITDITIAGNLLYTASNDHTVRTWELRAERRRGMVSELDLHPRRPNSVAIAPGNDLLAIGFASGELSLHALPSTELLWTRHAHDTNITRMAFDHTGQRLATASFDTELKLWQVSPRTNSLIRTYTQHANVINDVVFSPDGRYLATASLGSQLAISGGSLNNRGEGGGQITVIDTETHRERAYSAHRSEVMSVAFDRSGRQLISSGDDGNTIVWNHDAGALTKDIGIPADRELLYTVEFHPDGRRMATAGRGGVVKIKDRTTPKDVIRMSGHENAIIRLMFSPDGQQVISVSTDGTLRFWDLHVNRQFFSIRLPVSHEEKAPLWDFHYNYHPEDGGYIAVPLTNGRVMLYHFGRVFDIGNQLPKSGLR